MKKIKKIDDGYPSETRDGLPIFHLAQKLWFFIIFFKFILF